MKHQILPWNTDEADTGPLVDEVDYQEEPTDIDKDISERNVNQLLKQ